MYPGWSLGQNPGLHIGFISNTSDQANRPSVAVRSIIESSPEYHSIFPDIKPDYDKGWSEKEWYLQRPWIGDKDASFKAAGMYGGILGIRLDKLIIDDAQDESNVYTAHQRKRVKDWINTTARSRVVPGGGIAAVMTRWDADDLAGDFIPDKSFHVVHMPAIGTGREDCPTCADQDPERVIHYDGGIGKALWPEFWPLERLLEVRNRPSMTALQWETMYQGNPSIEAGNIFKRDDWRYYDALPDHFDDILQSWDTAFKDKKSSDYSACVTIGKINKTANHNEKFYIINVFRKKMTWAVLEKTAQTHYMKYNPSRVCIEDKGSGTSLLDALESHTTIKIRRMPAKSSKGARAHSISGYVENGYVYLPRPENTAWVMPFLDEMSAFNPDVEDAKDDQADSFTHCMIAFMKRRPSYHGIV